MSLNVDGLRQRRRVAALGKFIASLDEQPDVCVLVETHLMEIETEGIRLDTYREAHSHCREDEVEEACGGVLIMVNGRVSFAREDELPGASLPLSSCSIRNNPELPAIRLTGVFLPPSAKPKIEQVKMLTDHRSDSAHKGVRIGHIMTGDFNHPSWPTHYADWVGSYGIWELTDRNKETYASGNSLGKFLYKPGDVIPSNFLQYGHPEEEEDIMEDCYPGETHDKAVAGNRHPVFLRIPVQFRRI